VTTCGVRAVLESSGAVADYCTGGSCGRKCATGRGGRYCSGHLAGNVFQADLAAPSPTGRRVRALVAESFYSYLALAYDVSVAPVLLQRGLKNVSTKSV